MSPEIVSDVFLPRTRTFGGSHPEVLDYKAVLENFLKLTGKHLC